MATQLGVRDAVASAPPNELSGGHSAGAGDAKQTPPCRVRSDIRLVDGAIPLTWWTFAPNFGDLLSPYLVRALTGIEVKLIDKYPSVPGIAHRLAYLVRARHPFSYLAVGSIINRADAKSVVWGSGAFGTEHSSNLSRGASYRAVRGPLTRNLLRLAGIDCPQTYGDPALLMPTVYRPAVPKTHRVGVIVRHSERDRLRARTDDDVLLIDMRRDDIETAISDMLSCERLVAASLHGLILADAYGIPSAWLSSNTPKGLEFKFDDYFLSIDKVRRPQEVDFSVPRLTSAQLDRLTFDDRPIKFDRAALLEACPFIEP